jgi:hypothetical protein
MGGKCCGFERKKRAKYCPNPINTNLLADPMVLYSDSRYFKPKQQLYYNQLLLEEAPIKEIKVPNS